MTSHPKLIDAIRARFMSLIENVYERLDEVTVELIPAHLIEVAQALRDEFPFNFELLLDICGVDYLDYGISHWRTEETTTSGFSRGVVEGQQEQIINFNKPRFAAVYHLLSVKHNQRLRLKVFIQGELKIPSLIVVWNSANWYEREAFDLFGIEFEGHPDLRRLLTDYGFVGHPFRKDFPLIGEVELRYDAATQRCVYEKVSIQPRVLVPKVIRQDHRYFSELSERDDAHPDKAEAKNGRDS